MKSKGTNAQWVSAMHLNKPTNMETSEASTSSHGDHRGHIRLWEESEGARMALAACMDHHNEAEQEGKGHHRGDAEAGSHQSWGVAEYGDRSRHARSSPDGAE